MKKILLILSVLCASVLSAQEPLNLSQCIEKASHYNRSLQNAVLNLRGSKEYRKQMYAKYFPEISANVTAFQAFDKIIKADGTYPEELASLAAVNPEFAQLAGTPYSFHELNRSYSALLTVTQPIYAGGQITAVNKLSRIDQEIAELQLNLKEKDVIQKVTENFWQIAQLYYNLQTITAAEKQLAAVYEQVNNYVETGVATRNALLKVKLQQQELASNRLKLENASHILSMLLAQQIGLGATTISLDLPEADITPDLPAYIAGTTASYNREELQLSGKGVESQRMLVKLERGKCLPTLAVGLMGYHTGLGGLSETIKSNISTSMTNAVGFVTLSVPISAWFGGSHAIRQAKINLAQSKNEYLDMQENLAIDIESAWSSLVEARKQIDIARASVEEAKENFRMATDQYTTGKETITDLLDAETLNRQAQDQLYAAIASYHICYADYQRKIQ